MRSRKLALVLILAGPFTADLLATSQQGSGNKTEINEFFELHSGFWLNLHHFLYLQAVLATPGARKDGAIAVNRTLPVRQLTSEQRAKWDKALAYYRQFGNSDPLWDGALITANYELSDAGNSSSLDGRRLTPEMRTSLEEAAPVYRALWWNDQDDRIGSGSRAHRCLSTDTERICRPGLHRFTGLSGQRIRFRLRWSYMQTGRALTRLRTIR